MAEQERTTEQYRTAGGLLVHREVQVIEAAPAVDALVDRLDRHRGVLLSSSYEYPGRYTRWDLGFADPPLVVWARDRAVHVEALNERGEVLVEAVAATLGAEGGAASFVESVQRRGAGLVLVVRRPDRRFDEEERSRQPSVFSVVRHLIGLFRSPEDPHLGLYGAFGYDLAFQFEPMRLRLGRPTSQRDLVLYLPDELLVVDHRREYGELRRYDFTVLAGGPAATAAGRTTAGLARTGAELAYRARPVVEAGSDHAPGEYAVLVEAAKEAFKRGDLFEVVPGQQFTEACPSPPSALFRRLRERNPSPYGFVINLGAVPDGMVLDGTVPDGTVPAGTVPDGMAGEWLVGASPEMYVRVEDDRVETCPISGTIARGADPISDAAQILALLNSDKDASELTMCTDVDRNDKSRICVPGSVKVIGRRQIEMYSRLIHTVDHVEGRLRPGFDALDAFLSHTWAVTVTGAPKAWAMQWIEDHERSPRAWYGGAVGMVGFNGNMNTGLTLRTIRLVDGAAQVRVGATLLFDSDPEAEEAETVLKASAFLDAIREPAPAGPASAGAVTAGARSGLLNDAGPLASQPGAGRRLLLVDHQDSFVHTLANYFRATGAEVVTVRCAATGEGLDEAELDRVAPDLVVLSPGPGRPSDFGVSATVGRALSRGLPIFGVCLGLQGIVEHFGGRLGQLQLPMHGKASVMKATGGRLFEGLAEQFLAGRYHSLHAPVDELPECLETTAESDDGVVMAVEHRELPVAAVQFHPESIMSLGDEAGMRLVANVVRLLRGPDER
ncbi:MAG: anthranilate synthase component I [Acidimicrobiia bacterium]